MRKLHVAIAAGLTLMFTVKNVFAQGDESMIKAAFIEPYKLLLTTSKTTNLVFPFPIMSVDRGSSDIIAQKVKGIENILQVKAGTKNFQETNLTVIMADGKLYSFLLQYNQQPPKLNFRFYEDTPETASPKVIQKPIPSAVFSKEPGNMAAVQQTAQMIIRNGTGRLGSIRDKKYKMLIRLTRIYVREDMLYYRVELKNISNINYDVDILRFYIRDQKQTRRNATQEIEIKPVYTAGNTSVIKAHSKSACVFAFRKFTIPDSKYFVCEVREKSGGRNLSIRVYNSQIINAHMLKGS